jgi:hypothetical protein
VKLSRDTAGLRPSITNAIACGSPLLTSFFEAGTLHSAMSTQDILVEEIKKQPEPVLREVLHYLKFLTRQREEEAWADVLPTREVEQEVLDILDRK